MFGRRRLHRADIAVRTRIRKNSISRRNANDARALAVRADGWGISQLRDIATKIGEGGPIVLRARLFRKIGALAGVATLAALLSALLVVVVVVVVSEFSSCSYK